MYAVIEDSGQQFRVCQGDVLDVDLRELADDAKEVTFDRVLLVSDEDDVKIGTPLVTGAKVVAEVVDPKFKGKKVHIYHLRRRKASRTKKGHRQKYLRVRITSIDA
ncbi:MAG: 50S ribosomal protein L21 [Phycisphaerae bacterium]|jgi:large subunit ribosomal protein L21|nr:50S ribosomal protein L21 [Phycisphaerae bacterium]